MIISFGDKRTERIWLGETVRSLPIEIQQVARRKLRMINNAQNIMDLRIPPANRLEKLVGTGLPVYSIRINDQWRIVFEWNNGQASGVIIADYH